MDVVRLCSELVKIRSENPPGDTVDIAHYVKGFLESIGIKTKLVQHRGGRCNLISDPVRKRLLCCGHLDVVPVMREGWVHDPFSGHIDGDFVWGRGSTDMKGGCAALLTAFRTLVDKGIEPAADLAFVCDEETGGKYGMQCLLAKKIVSPCDCLIAEPTHPLHPTIGQKGLLRLNITFTGEPGHASLYPKIGTSAIMEAFSLMEYVRYLHGKKYPVDPEIEEVIDDSCGVLEEIFGIGGLSDVLQKIMYNPGTIRGGEKANIVAQHCNLELDLRIPWGCAVDLLLDDLRSHAPNGKFSIENRSDPSFTTPGCPLVKTVCREIGRIYSGSVAPVVQWAATDARHLRQEGFDVIEYGPGEITTLHAVNEKVRIDALRKVTEIYEGIISTYSAGK